ncbi:hypothetical protein Pan216_51590 [Planctomycetes bacterium Pan216]|uniref:SseB protein N-terminal domain-containing protein n=1 Tax=Kolteria novifilia TaxID=2527975 RepID=A0A518BBC3_9BACT|nr:hypothetical protein Pan216_51590 [Planctomycetes bacterium Pan216]
MGNERSFYVPISNDGSNEMPIIPVNDDKGSHLLFTTPEKADEYIHLLEWDEEFAVGELPADALLPWMLELHESNVDYIFIDPSASSDSQEAVDVAQLLEGLNETLIETLTPESDEDDEDDDEDFDDEEEEESKD